ncbi:uncharacterized protein BKA78DRAFT_311419 [Phyllosticta capitalensis]|uniref:uncharacterized protein n=1 Tax=Phyllosticta capitalensis TaxID=121624 RepID=UPI00312DF461
MDQSSPSDDQYSRSVVGNELRGLPDDGKPIPGPKVSLLDGNLDRCYRIADLITTAYELESWQARDRLRVEALSDYLEAVRFYPQPHTPQIVRHLKPLQKALERLGRKQRETEWEQFAGQVSDDVCRMEMEVLAKIPGLQHDDDELDAVNGGGSLLPIESSYLSRRADRAAQLCRDADCRAAQSHQSAQEES